MNHFLKILIFLLTWFTASSNAIPVLIKVDLPSYAISFPTIENQQLESEVKIGVQNFARSSIEKAKEQNTTIHQTTFSLSSFLKVENSCALYFQKTRFHNQHQVDQFSKKAKLSLFEYRAREELCGVVQGAGNNIFSTLKTEINILSKQVKSHTVLEAEYLAKYPGSTNYPYLTTAPVEDIVVSTNTKFVRFHDANNINREWMMSIDDFNAHIANGGTLDNIVEKLALPTKPTKISLVEIPANETIRKSIAGPQQWSGIPYQTGGYTQYQILGFSQSNPIPLSWYSQTTDLNLIFP